MMTIETDYILIKIVVCYIKQIYINLQFKNSDNDDYEKISANQLYRGCLEKRDDNITAKANKQKTNQIFGIELYDNERRFVIK